LSHAVWVKQQLLGSAFVQYKRHARNYPTLSKKIDLLFPFHHFI
jgi:hypothetical protein